MQKLLLICCVGLASVTGFAAITKSATAADRVTDELEYTAFQDDETRIPSVRKVKFRGNKTFSNMVLREIVGTRQPGFFRRMQFWKKNEFQYSEQEIRRDVIRIRRFYNRRGFYEANISYEVETGRRAHQRLVTFHIDEGPWVKVRSLEYEFITDDPEIERHIRESRTFYRANTGLRNRFHIGERYNFIKHGSMEAQLTRRLMNLGYAFVEVDIEAEVDTLALTADVLITIEPGPIAYFKNISAEGAETVDNSKVEYQSDLREGDRFSSTKLRRAQQLLFRHPLFRFVTVNLPDQPVSNEVDVRIRVREYPLRTLQLQGGVGNEEILRGRVSWTHRNPFGNGHRFTITTRASFIEQRANLEYLIPGIFTPRSNLSVSPFVLRQNERNYLLRTAGIRNNVSYYHNQYFVVNLGHEYSRNEIFQKEGNIVRRDSTFLYDISSLTLAALYNESTGSRGRGWAFRPYLETSGFLNTGSITYQKVALDVRRFIDITESTQIALRADNGVLFSDSPFSIPANIRFYAGGTNSVRGWSRSQLGPKRAVFDDDGNFRDYIPLGGQVLSMFNIEIRQDLPLFEDGVQVVAFLDGGQVWLENRNINLNDYQYGLGGGVRYMSPIGPIRLDFGYKLNPTEADMNRFEGVGYGGINRWNLHFSIGQAF